MRISKRFADSLLMTARSSVGVFIVVGRLRLPSARLGDDSIARLHANAADVDAAWTGDQVLDLAIRLATEGATQDNGCLLFSDHRRLRFLRSRAGVRLSQHAVRAQSTPSRERLVRRLRAFRARCAARNRAD